MTMLLDERLRDLATQTHLLETKVSSLGWMAGADTQTLKSMTRAQAHLMLAECNLLDALEATKRRRTTMSEKPFWEGKTCKEMANLHVKVTFVTGAVLTGITDCSGHIRRSRNGSVVPISANRGQSASSPTGTSSPLTVG